MPVAVPPEVSAAEKSDDRWRIFTDITSAWAAASVFRRGRKRDLWGPEVLGYFADILIYADEISIPLPLKSNDRDAHYENGYFKNPFLKEIDKLRDIDTLPKISLLGEEFHTEEVAAVDSNKMRDAFNSYFNWAFRTDNTCLKSFSEFHHTEFVNGTHQRTIGTTTLFEIKDYIDTGKLEALVKITKLPESYLLYCFDVVFRYGLYGGLLSDRADKLGKDTPYFCHPLRRQFKITELSKSDLEEDPGRFVSPPPVSFARAFKNSAHKYTQKEFFESIRALREMAFSTDLRYLHPKDINREILRKLALQGNMRGRLKVLSPMAATILKASYEDVKKLMVGTTLGATAGGLIAGSLGADAANRAAIATMAGGIGAILGSGKLISVAGQAWRDWNPLLPSSGVRAWKQSWLQFDLETTWEYPPR